MTAGVVAVVVSWRPVAADLHCLLGSIAPQVDEVVVVDNGSPGLEPSRTVASVTGCRLVALGENRGVAAAQNVGVAEARRRGASHVILFDQDSEPAPDMVATLVRVARDAEAGGLPVAAVGPRYMDERQGNPPPFIRVRGLRVEHLTAAAPDAVVEVDYLVSSGCLIPMSALDVVGGMREELFIDYVDIEWGLRARSLGLRCFGSFGATMRHSLGETPLRFLGRSYPAHSPLRHYYHMRNAVWLYRQAWVPPGWKAADALRLVLKYGFYTLFARPRPLHWWMMTRGLWDGLRGRTGPCPA